MPPPGGLGCQAVRVEVPQPPRTARRCPTEDRQGLLTYEAQKTTITFGLRLLPYIAAALEQQEKRLARVDLEVLAQQIGPTT